MRSPLGGQFGDPERITAARVIVNEDKQHAEMKYRMQFGAITDACKDGADQALCEIRANHLFGSNWVIPSESLRPEKLSDRKSVV